MRGDVLKKVQVEHFRDTAKRFRERIFSGKGLFFHLKPFFMTPLGSVSATNFCRQEKIDLITCEKAYYPERTAKRKLGEFYREYRRVMGVPNLEVISYNDLPIASISRKIKTKAFGEMMLIPSKISKH